MICREEKDMEPTANPLELIKYIPQPAFLVKDGVIIAVNPSASALLISEGASVSEMITLGASDYAAFKSGKLYLELKAGRAWGSVCDDAHLFCMEENYSSPALRAFALAAQHLRTPLSTAVSGAEILMQNDTMQENADLKQYVGQINRSLYQMLRAICNMSDISQLGAQINTKLELVNVSSVFDDIFEKAAHLARDSQRKLTFTGLKTNVDCAVDVQLLERIVLNLLSNAIKFSPTGDTIKSTLKLKDKRLTFTIENNIQDSNAGFYSNAFNRFLREPGIESGQTGIGLGMSVISRAVAAHNGTVLLDTTKKTGAKVAVSLPIRTEIKPELKAPAILLEGYTGGIDNFLVELSEVLPSNYYESV